MLDAIENSFRCLQSTYCSIHLQRCFVVIFCIEHQRQHVPYPDSTYPIDVVTKSIIITTSTTAATAIGTDIPTTINNCNCEASGLQSSFSRIWTREY